MLKFLVPPGLRVLEIGCGDGQLLASTRPAFGLGVDFSTHMMGTASRTHPELRFAQADAHRLCLVGTFDIVILSDLLNDV